MDTILILKLLTMLALLALGMQFSGAILDVIRSYRDRLEVKRQIKRREMAELKRRLIAERLERARENIKKRP